MLPWIVAQQAEKQKAAAGGLLASDYFAL